MQSTLTVTLVLVVILATQTVAAECVVHSDRADVEELLVNVPGQPPLRLFVLGAPVDVRRGTAGGEVAIDVRGTLEFTGRADNVPLRPARPLDTAGGAARLTTTSRLHILRFRGALLVARADLAPGVTVRAVSVSCEALTIDEPDRAIYSTASWDEPPWLSRTRTLGLGLRPGRRPVVTVSIRRPADLPLAVTARRGGYVLVERYWSDGAGVRGWARSEDLYRPADVAMLASLAPGRGGCGTTGGCGGGGIYCGLAEIAPGTPVTTSPEGRQWATVREARRAVVRWVRREPWAQITGLSDLREGSRCGHLEHAWVPAAALTIAR
jgi:hypothetical protein